MFDELENRLKRDRGKINHWIFTQRIVKRGKKESLKFQKPLWFKSLERKWLSELRYDEY